MSSPEEARSSSEQVLADLGLEVRRALPLLDPPEASRDKDELVQRSLALHAVLAAAYGYPAEEARGWIDRHGVRAALAPREARFLDGPDEGLAVELQYDVEALWALAWCLGIVRTLDFRTPCDDALVDEMPDVEGGDDEVDRFVRRARRRDDDEILRAADLAYLLNWLHRDAELRGVSPPRGVVDSRIVESRRRALEWVLYADDWDEITLDT